MLIKDLDGNNINWTLTGHIAKGRIANKSSLHLQARLLLNKAFPTMQILEEVPIQLRKGETLFLDFYLPLKRVCVEVHGEQHYKFIQFYHTTILNFFKSQKRDREKQEWCQINNIKYIALPFNETEQQWQEKINNE